MGKFIFWIIVIFAVLMCLRLYNASQQKKRARRDQAAQAQSPKAAEAMVRCTRCGVYLPRSEARLIDGALRCRDKECA